MKQSLRLNARFPTGCLFLLFVLATGCSSGDLGTVTGTVKAGGKPLPNAKVTFFPRPDGRASIGMTDENGEYELIYTRDDNGAEIGEHLVQITTAVEQGDYGDKIAPEKLPTKYNLASELKEEVKSGNNVIDFNLDFEGKIVQGGY